MLIVEKHKKYGCVLYEGDLFSYYGNLVELFDLSKLNSESTNIVITMLTQSPSCPYKTSHCHFSL